MHTTEYADYLDDGIDPVAGLRHVGPPEENEDRHERFNDQLSGTLGEAMPIPASDDAAFGEHVDDRGHEQPPVASFVAIVEEAVFPPSLLILVQCRGVTLSFLVPSGQLPDTEGEEHKDGGEDGECHCCEGLGRPRIAVGELVDTV